MEYEQWFSKYPELDKLYKLFGYEELLNPLRYHYTPIPSCVQEGPQCGLVALAMLMQNSSKNAINELFECAKNANFTYNGEMFSVENMCELAKTKLKDIKIEVYRGNLSCKYIKEFLLNGGFMLVPYPYSSFLFLC